MLYALFAEIRTTGRYGNRPNAIPTAHLSSQGWRAYFDDTTRPSGARASFQPSGRAEAAVGRVQVAWPLL